MHRERIFTSFRASLPLVLVGLALLMNPSGGLAPANAESPCELVTPQVSAEASPRAAACDEARLASGLADRVRSRDPIEVEHLHLSRGALPQPDPADASRPLFQPRKDLPPWPVELPLDWSADPFNDRNWRYQLNAWRPLDPHLLAHATDGDPAHLKFSLSVVTDWARFHLDEGRSHPFAWYDMAVGLRAMKLAYLIDQGFRSDELEPHDVRLLLRVADEHLERLLDPDFIRHNNHGLFQLHGTMALCKASPELLRCTEAKAFVERTLSRLVATQYNLEFLHQEHSPEYHFFVTRAVRRFTKSGWYDDLQHLGPLLDLVQQNQRWLIHPDGRIVQVGDTSPSSPEVDLPAGDPACRGTKSFESSCYLVRSFYQTGYGIVRSDWAVESPHASMLFLTAAFHSPAHKQADDLSFELFEHGLRVIADGGKYSYTQDSMRDYIVSSRAHNTVEIGTQPWSVYEIEPYGSGLDGVYRFPWGFVLAAEVVDRQRDTRHRRVLLYRPGEWLVIVDRATSSDPEPMTAWLHFDPELDLTLADDRATALLSDRIQLSVQQASSPTRCDTRLVKAQESPRLQGWRAVGYNQVAPAYALARACSDVSDGTFLSVLLFHERDSRPRPLDFKVQDSGTITVRFGADGEIEASLDPDSLNQGIALAIEGSTDR